MYKFYFTKPDSRCNNGVRNWMKEFPTKEGGFKYATASKVTRVAYTEPGSSRIHEYNKILG